MHAWTRIACPTEDQWMIEEMTPPMSRIAVVGNITPSARKPALSRLRELVGTNEFVDMTLEQLHLDATVVLPLLADDIHPHDVPDAAAEAVAKLFTPLHAIIMRDSAFDVQDLDSDPRGEAAARGLYTSAHMRSNMEALFGVLAAGNGRHKLLVCVIGDSHFPEVHTYYPE